MSTEQTTGASAPSPQPVKPSLDQTAKMASDMLSSAVSQKDTIARSFEEQRAEVLRSVEQLKEQHLESKTGPADATQTAAGAASSTNEVPPATPEELAVLQQMMQMSHRERAHSTETVMNEIVAIIRRLISEEISRQLDARRQ